MTSEGSLTVSRAPFSDEALLLHSEVLKFSKPNQRVWRVFRGWFETVKPFVGYGNHLLQQPDDFVALKPSPDPDFLGRFLQNLGGKCLPVRDLLCNTLLQLYFLNKVLIMLS